MSAIPPILPVAIEPATTLATPAPVQAAPSGSFASLLTDGLNGLEAKVSQAESLVKRFALGDNIPVHQVTFALEEARLAVELAMQVRARVLEGYRDLMNMQL